MTYGAFSTRDGARYARRPRKETSYTLICAMALMIGGGVGAAILYANEPEPLKAAVQSVANGTRIIPLIVMPIAAPAVQIARADPMFDPTLSTTVRPTTFDQTAALGSGFSLISAPAILPPPPATVVTTAEPASASNEEEPVAVASVAVTPAPPEVSLPPVAVPAIPLPLPRPVFQTDTVPLPRSAPGRRSVATLAPPPSVSPSDPKSFFDTMFGGVRPPESVLAYAAPEDRGLGRPIAIPPRAPEAGVAVYDISAHTVTLPNGTRLEAHSGLGPRLDDPRSVTEHMRGATPPNVYELTLREAPFHGVRALRLNPIAGTTFGRGGLLAHTFMLGPRGDSNGCVVFRNYAAFLQAYESGQIRRLMVVARS